ncbi:hypothetical protein GCM10017673_49820 [Streptosporangium violaceochromogenes]|nr:hypothetical protein GCM10017673_49820 [Streptosporangium violaceochromogenes]
MVAGLTLLTLVALWAGARIDAASAGECRGGEGLVWVMAREGGAPRETVKAVAAEGDPRAGGPADHGPRRPSRLRDPSGPPAPPAR